MRLMGAEGELAAQAVQYLRVYALFSPLTTILFAVDNYLRICGKIRTSMVLNIFMAAMCALLEFIFLYVFRFGVWGRGPWHLHQYEYLYGDCLCPLFPRKTGSEILQAPVQPPQRPQGH